MSAPGGGHRTWRGLAGWSVCDLLQVQPAAAILDGKVSGLVFPHHDAALCGGMVAALARQLEQAAFVADHPVQAHHAFLFELEDRVQVALGRPPAMEVRVRRRSPREAPVVVGEVVLFEEAVGSGVACDSGQPQR